MQNIETILKEFGLEIPADKAQEFSKKVAENYVTKAEHEKKIGKIETDRDTWKEKAETAETTLKSFEGIEPDKIQSELKEWQQKAEEAEKNAQKQIYERDFKDALTKELFGIKFTSEAAKNDVMRQITAAELKLKDGKILGLTDLLDQIKKNDESAFVNEMQEKLENNRARFTTVAKPTNGATIGAMTREQIEAIPNKAERQRAIAEHISLFK